MSTNTAYRKNQEGLIYRSQLNDLTADTAILKRQFYNSQIIYGNVDNTMTEDAPVRFTVVGGDDAWGTELMLTDGTVIGGGLSTSFFTLNKMYTVSVSVADKISIVEFLYSAINSSIACTFTFTGGTVEDQVDCIGHGLSDGDKIVFTAGAGALPAELNDYTVYYVVNSDADYFNVSLTSGGARVEFTDDGGACFWYPIESGIQGATQYKISTELVCGSATVLDPLPYKLTSLVLPCNRRLFVRAKSETGETVSIGFALGILLFDDLPYVLP